MIVHVRRGLAKVLQLDFFRFCVVGGTGFVINLVLLTFLYKFLHFNIFLAQLISSEVALFSNFNLHHNWTYRNKNVKKSIPHLLLQFHATSWPAILGSSFMVGVGVKIFHLSNIVALVITSIIILMWNFVWSKFVIWRNVTDEQLEKSLE